MDKANLWITQAEEDLLWAKASLKAFLLAKNITSPKIHDLVTLNQKCFDLEPSFKDLEDACNLLSPYYISSRYPDVAQFEHYSQDQAKEVVKRAETILNFVKSLLSN